MKISALTLLTIANFIVLIAGLALVRVGIVNPFSAFNHFVAGVLIAAICMGTAAVLDRRGVRVADMTYPANCA